MIMKKFNFENYNKKSSAVVLVIILLAGYVVFDVYGKVKINLQTRYFSSGVSALMKELVIKSENCQKIKVATGEEFVRTSCIREEIPVSSEVKPAPFTEPNLQAEPTVQTEPMVETPIKITE